MSRRGQNDVGFEMEHAVGFKRGYGLDRWIGVGWWS